MAPLTTTSNDRGKNLMKPCPQCQVVGELLTAEYIGVGGNAIQTLDTELKCKEHGPYEGNWTPEAAKEIVESRKTSEEAPAPVEHPTGETAA